MNLAFYTRYYGPTNTSSYKIPDLPSIKYNCYYYTNNLDLLEELKNTKWIGIYDDVETINDGGISSQISCTMASKKIRCVPFLYDEISKYDFLCCIDSKLPKIDCTFIENLITTYFINNSKMLLIRNHTFIEPNNENKYNVLSELLEALKHDRYKVEQDKYLKYIARQTDSGFKLESDNHCQTGFIIYNMKNLIHPFPKSTNTKKKKKKNKRYIKDINMFKNKLNRLRHQISLNIPIKNKNKMINRINFIQNKINILERSKI